MFDEQIDVHKTQTHTYMHTLLTYIHFATDFLKDGALIMVLSY